MQLVLNRDNRKSLKSRKPWFQWFSPFAVIFFTKWRDLPWFCWFHQIVQYLLSINCNLCCDFSTKLILSTNCVASCIPRTEIHALFYFLVKQVPWRHSVKSFLPRDDMQARPMPPCGVCACVCLSVTFVHSVKTNKDIFEIFSPLGTILVFPYQTGWRYSDGTPPPNGGVECRWGRQKSRFWAWLDCLC